MPVRIRPLGFMEGKEKSGTFLVRVPKALHAELAQHAEREGISLNQYVGTILAAAAGQQRISNEIERQQEAISDAIAHLEKQLAAQEVRFKKAMAQIGGALGDIDWEVAGRR